MSQRRVLGAVLGDGPRTGALVRFLQVAEVLGCQVRNLGAVSVLDRLIALMCEWNPEIVVISCTPALQPVLVRLQKAALAHGQAHRRWVLLTEGVPPEEAGRLDLFAAVFDQGATYKELADFLRGARPRAGPPPQALVDRIRWKEPSPLLCLRFGQPTVAATADGIRLIAKAGVADIISLTADEGYRREELYDLYAATRGGNQPLIRCEGGPGDQVQWAILLQGTIKNASGSVPLFWNSALDGRSKRPLAESISAAREALEWHGKQGLSVASDDSCRWSLHYAPDTVSVAVAYIAAHNARQAGVRDYVQPLTWNSPALTAPVMDLAKMLAQLELVESLCGPDFRVWRECRSGQVRLPADTDRLKGHLAAATLLQMLVQPHIIEVPGQSLSTAEAVIGAGRAVEEAVRLAREGLPDLAADPVVQARKEELVAEARLLLEAVVSLGSGAADPLTDPQTLALAVNSGLLDAPGLAGSREGLGQVSVQLVDGSCRAVDPATGEPLAEPERYARLIARSEAG